MKNKIPVMRYGDRPTHHWNWDMIEPHVCLIQQRFQRSSWRTAARRSRPKDERFKRDSRWWIWRERTDGSAEQLGISCQQERQNQ